MPKRSAAQYRGTKLAIITMLAIVVVLGGGVVASALYLQGKLNSGIERFGDPFAGLTARPVDHTDTGTAPVNFLLLGSDSRISAGDPSQWEEGAQRTDAIMIAQLSANRRNAAVLSIPRDSWVPIPGHGEGKINAAFSLGGPALTVRTVEELTGVAIDHVVVADFESFAEVTDVVGGVLIELTEPTVVANQELAPGSHVLDGATALSFVRQRADLPEGDLSRVQRHQMWLRGVLHAVHREGVLTNPGSLVRFLEVAGETLAVDDHLTVDRMRDLAFAARNLDASDIVFITAPVAELGRSPDGTQSIVVLDDDALAPLTAALAAGSVNEYVAENPHAVRTLQASDS